MCGVCVCVCESVWSFCVWCVFDVVYVFVVSVGVDVISVIIIIIIDNDPFVNHMFAMTKPYCNTNSTR